MKLQLVLRIQAVYYLLTGGWPLIDIGSFMQVTGPKTDIWLVKMVGLLSLVIGAALLVPGSRNALVLCIGAALAFGGIDVFYSAARVISPVYLVDAAIQLLFILLALVARNRN